MTNPRPRFPATDFVKDSIEIINIAIRKCECVQSLQNKLSTEIEIDTSTEYIYNTAELKRYIDADNKEFFQICVWDNYCQFLWTLCYFTFVCVNEYDIKGKLRNKAVTDQAFEMFKTAMLLFNENENERPDNAVFFNFPNPQDYADNIYVSKTNNIFATSLAFILLHEYSHFEYRHHKKENEQSDELEADYGALYRMLLIDQLNPDDKFTIATSSIIGLQSIIFLDNTLKGDYVYPDPDERLSRILNELYDLSDDQKEFCYATAVATYKIWAFTYGFHDLISDVNFKNYKGYLEKIQKTFTEMKEKNVNLPTHQS